MALLAKFVLCSGSVVISFQPPEHYEMETHETKHRWAYDIPITKGFPAWWKPLKL